MDTRGQPAANAARALLVQLGVLGPLQGEVVHQSLVAEDEANDGILDVFGVDGSAGSELDERNRAVNAGFPPGAVAKIV